MRNMRERLQRLEDSQERQNHGRRRIHYGNQEEEDGDWRMQHYGERRHHQHNKSQMPNVKLPSFSGNCDPNVYLGWEAKVEQIFSMYDVDDN